MESYDFIWETTLDFLDFKDRVGLRLLSKTFNVLILRTIKELVIGQDDQGQEEIISRFGPYVKHLFLDDSWFSINFIIDNFKNIHSLSLRNHFLFAEYENGHNVEKQGLVLLTQKLRLENMLIFVEFSTELLSKIIYINEFSSFACNLVEESHESKIVLRRLNFVKLKTLSISRFQYEKSVLKILEKRAVKLNNLDISLAIITLNEPFYLPVISSLKVAHFDFAGLEESALDAAFLCLNNSRDFPNLTSLHLSHEPQYVPDSLFKIDIPVVWPQITSLRLLLKNFYDIDFKRCFPNLINLSYDLEFVSESQTNSFLTTINHVKSLFLFNPTNLANKNPVYLVNLTRLSLTFTFYMPAGPLKYISNCVPNLTELSVIANVDSFQKVYLEAEYQLNSLVRLNFYRYYTFSTDQQIWSTFWTKLIREAPKLRSIHAMDWALFEEKFSNLFPQLSFNPHYNMEKKVFPDIVKYY